MNKKKIALTIAGSDPTTGAGIQADLKTFTAIEVHGVTVLTCITVQNTKKVQQIFQIPDKLINNQIDVLLKDIKPDTIKTGMLYNAKIVRCVTNKIKEYQLKTIVDPIITSTSGDELCEKNYLSALKKDLIPKAFILTPNIIEASILADFQIKSINDMKNGCYELYKLGVKYVLIKGGHLKGEDVTDVLYDGEKIYEFSLPRINKKNIHGTGCTLSALITGLLAKNYSVIESVKKSKLILWEMINNSYIIGRGADVLNFYKKSIRDAPPYLSKNHFNVWLELKNSIHKVISFLSAEYIPEVGMNFGYALSNAKKIEDICAIKGRIVNINNKPIRMGSLDFGITKHIGSIILASMSFNKNYRSALNIRYSPEIIEKYDELGFKIGSFNRVYEPKNAGSTMEWGTKTVIKNLNFVPDVIYDKGDIGKEPMIRILGKNPKDVMNKVKILTN
jgi:hydroxymethylpyrimidine/phosphomethylpyrimidine kinase